MDRRKIKARGGLHKNLVGSQASSASGLSLDARSLSTGTSSQKSISASENLHRDNKLVDDEVVTRRTTSSNAEALRPKLSNDETLTRKTKLSNTEALLRQSKSSNDQAYRENKKSNDRPSPEKRKFTNSEILLRKNKQTRNETLCQSETAADNASLLKSKTTNNETSSRKRKSPRSELSTRKRKSPSFTASGNESDDDIGFPLAESTVLKKRKNESKCTDISRGSDTPEIAPSNQSIVSRRNLNASVNNECKFVEFLREAGITLNSNHAHMLNKDLILVQKDMKLLLSSGRYRKAEIISLMEKYLENEQNLENALNEMQLAVNSEVSNILKSSSLIKILLQISELHPEIYTKLLSKLNESLLLADSIEAVPWTRLLIQQFRFLDVVMDTDIVTSTLEQLLESCPAWFHNELLLYLPDIITDKQHQTVAEMLNKFLAENSELTNLILNCMSNLNLGKEQVNEFREKVLDLLKTNLKMDAIPAIVKFVLEDHTNTEIFVKTLRVLRSIDLQPLTGEKLEDYYKNQWDIIATVKMTMFLSKNIVNATICVVKDITKDPKPLDIILLLLVFTTTETKRKNVETMFKQYIRSGFYRPSLLSLFYNDYKLVTQELQPSILQLSSNLLKTDERVFVDFGTDWLRLQFLCHKESVFKQREILERVVLLMGDNEHTAKNALTFLCKMVGEDDERQCLASHCNHLRILLDKMDNLGLEEVGTLNDLLHNLCTNASSAAGSLHDDLFILLQKQLSNFKPITKGKGVLGAVMAIKHLMVKSGTSTEAYDLFKTVLNNVKNCPRSQALFYDQLARIIIETRNIDTNFIKNIAHFVEEEFINTYMMEKTDYKGELIPKFGLNNAEDDSQSCVLNFENKKYAAIIAISFKLLRSCCIRLSENGELDAIDSLLGCAILMPENLDIPDHSVLDLVVCCINWFREVINGFVMQSDPLLQKQVLRRLDNLIDLQSELSILLTLCDTKYQPTPCYFHHFPVPPFVRIEKKVGKKGKKGKKVLPEKSVNTSEIGSWELGSTICSKNPVYFRKLEATIAHLLGIKMELYASQSAVHSMSLKQVCFVVKELIGLFEQEPHEVFVKDLIHLLPKICSKLQEIVDSIREESNSEKREAAKLLLCLLTKIFNWKGFESVTYNALLREGLRTLAGQINKANGMLRSCKELVAESYKYFESLSDIATQVSLAISLINMCQSLMKHSESYTKQNKDKHAKIAFAFLCLQWPEDNHSSSQYKAAVDGLLNNWIDNESLPLKTVTETLEWLPDETSKLEKPQDCLEKLPAVRRTNFHSVYKKIFDALIKGAKIALSFANTDPERIGVWREIVSNVQKLVQISKTLKTKNNILIFLKYMPVLLKLFLNLGMPILEHNLRYQTEDVTKIVKMLQGGTRYLHTICCDSAEKKDITLTKYVPIAKSVLERLLYSVKGMLVLNNSPAAFWMGNLVNKNLDGLEIHSQNLSSEEISLPTSSDLITDDQSNESTDILNSDTNDDPVDEDEDVL